MLAYCMEKTNLIRPIFDRVLLEKIDEQQTDGGIIIPKSSDDRSHIMRVVAIGDVAGVLVGDRVIVAKYAGTCLRVADKTYTMVCAHDILGVFEEGQNG